MAPRRAMASGMGSFTYVGLADSSASRSSFSVKRWQTITSAWESTSLPRAEGRWVASTRDRPGCLPWRSHSFVSTAPPGLSPSMNMWASSMSSHTSGFTLLPSSARRAATRTSYSAWPGMPRRPILSGARAVPAQVEYVH